MNDEPIFILGVHKSGTSLFRSLLDGHPELFVIPFESHFLKLLGFWIQNAYRYNEPELVSNQEFIERVVNLATKYNKVTNPYADVVLKNKINLKLLKDYLIQNLKGINSKSRISTYFESIAYAYGKNNNKRIVEKSVENFEYATFINRVYPKARFIHIIRNPYSNLVSLRKFRQKGSGKYPRIDRAVKTINSGFYYAKKNSLSIPNYWVVNYENLVSNTKSEMQRVCELLNLSYSENMLHPTSQGKPWQGNSTLDLKFKSVNNQSLNHWIEEINSLEITAINRKLSPVIDYFDYVKIPVKRGHIWPIKGEGVKKFINNRIFLYL